MMSTKENDKRICFCSDIDDTITDNLLKGIDNNEIDSKIKEELKNASLYTGIKNIYEKISKKYYIVFLTGRTYRIRDETIYFLNTAFSFEYELILMADFINYERYIEEKVCLFKNLVYSNRFKKIIYLEDSSGILDTLRLINFDSNVTLIKYPEEFSIIGEILEI